MAFLTASLVAWLMLSLSREVAFWTNDYAVNVTHMVQVWTYSFVNVRETEPGPPCFTIRVITYPFHVVEILKNRFSSRFLFGDDSPKLLNPVPFNFARLNS